jgi:two-component system sensor histidine kinase CpxA
LIRKVILNEGARRIMRVRFPLYARILFWFFLNMVFLVGVVLVVARVQFRFGLDALVSGPAGERVQAVTRLLNEELKGQPRAEWDGVLKRFSDAYNVQFFLFRNDGEEIAGEKIELPAEVRARLGGRRGPGPPPGVAGGGRGGGDQPEFDGPPRGGPPPEFEGRPPMQREGPPPRAMIYAAKRYWVVTHMPMPGRDSGTMMPTAVVVSSESLSAGGLFFDATPWVMAGIGVVLVSALFWFPLVRGITRAISRMTQATERIAEGGFEVRTEVRRQDELGSLSDAINRMAERLAGLVGGQKRFLGDIAHELCSPIARIQVALGILEQRADERQKEYLKDLREEVEQMSGLVNELLSFSKASLGKANIQLLAVPVRSVVERAVARECDDGARVENKVAEELQAMAEPELLLRAVSNVLRNAVRYAGQAGPITISASRNGEWILLAVEDCGPGIPEAAREQVFDPFYRLDSSRTRDTGGVGLGLSIVKTCVVSCGGTVICENRQPAGLRVTMKLPAAE